ncbi:cysteine-rich motor neuron 1 protein-like isoform X2 [Rhynchophorus ferrugineus]|uniref:cysteine-rich motor neuron 1 protein-like isoform X2 n=1 Tax=Rhynchophorus ferrugineus TaxID=354439 RepID=UPI003FCD0DE8
MINFISVQAAPYIEACPPDSVPVDNKCACDASACPVPPCQWELELVQNGTDVPGLCCPIYECTGCANDSLIEDKCPCAPGAVINEKGVCECVDPEYHLVNGSCVCNPSQCELPQICDRKHVLVKTQGSCCSKYECKLCPEDSESTNYEDDALEDMCVCLPCKNDCGTNRTAVIKKKGNGFPGTCCDIYSCEPMEECVVGDIIYPNGDTWSIADTAQKCYCQNGLSLCEPVDGPLNCFDDDRVYNHTVKWKKEHGCTECECLNGTSKCISHYCEFKEAKIKENESLPCSFNDQIYQHLQTWIDKDNNCTCQCINGTNHCNSTTCEIKEVPNRNECRPLSDCNKQCSNGYRMNKKGCEICKCNSPLNIIQDIITKYNISTDEATDVLKNYAINKLKSTTSTESPPTTTSTTTTTSTSTTTTEMPLVTLVKRYRAEINQSTTEATVTQVPVTKGIGHIWIYLSNCIMVIVGILIGYLCKKCRSKQQSSSNHYEIVRQNDNNNTIKKTPL